MNGCSQAACVLRLHQLDALVHIGSIIQMLDYCYQAEKAGLGRGTHHWQRGAIIGLAGLTGSSNIHANQQRPS